jgi:hypothetical protein
MKNIFLFLMLMPSLAFAWSGTGEVTAVYSHNGDHVIRSTITSNACSSGAFWWPADDADAKDMFSLALAALVSGKKIGVVYNSNAPECRHGSSAKITHMVIHK